MKKIILFFILVLTAFFCASCGKKPEQLTINLPNELQIANATTLPQICVNNIAHKWNEFYYDDPNHYVYVYDGKIYIVQDAPNEFTTDLKVTYKKSKDVTATINLVKNFVPIERVSVVTNGMLAPGETITYYLDFFPQNALPEEYTVTFSNPEYIKVSGDGYFTLADDVPLGETFTVLFTLKNGLQRSVEFELIDQIYEVYNPSQFRRIANDVNGYYKLMADIDMQDVVWNPIPNFYGVINGNGHTIGNLTYFMDDKVGNKNRYYGLIQENYGYICNLKLKNCVFTVINSEGANDNLHLGALCAIMKGGKIYNIHMQGCAVRTDKYVSKDDSNICAYASVGGICGSMIAGTIEQCYIDDCVIYSRPHSIKNTCVNANAGGVVGEILSGHITYCVVENSSVIGVTRGNRDYHLNYCGGIAGFCGSNATIEFCSELNTTTESSVDNKDGWSVNIGSEFYAGSICGKADALVRDCVYTTSMLNGHSSGFNCTNCSKMSTNQIYTYLLTTKNYSTHGFTLTQSGQLQLIALTN